MYNEYKVSVFIFAGREATMKLLMPQLNDDIIDEIIIAKNTNNANDLAYLNSLQKDFPKVTYIELPQHIKQNAHTAWKYLYNFMQDRKTIYFKLDDDVIFIKPGYFSNTVKFKLDHPEYLCVFPVIVNNPYICSLLKVHPLMFNKGLTLWELMNAYFYQGKLGYELHDLFLKTHQYNFWTLPNHEFSASAVQWQYSNHPHLVTDMVDWRYAERMGINAMCYIGDDFANIDVAKHINDCYSDELFLMYNIFDYVPHKTHCILGTELVSHFAFSGQKGLRARTDLLDRYHQLIQRIYGFSD